MLEGVNKPIDEQLEIFEKIIMQNKKIVSTLKILETYTKENPAFKNYYLVAGSINQTIFNYYHGYDLNYGIKDFDVAYFDDDKSYEAEDVIISDLTEKLKDIDISFDIKNQARVYIWYNEKYGTNRLPYKSVEDAIASYGTTVTCLGVRLENGKFRVYCPYGLDDVFSMTIRPIKKDYTKNQYDGKAKRWKEKWEKLIIKAW